MNRVTNLLSCAVLVAAFVFSLVSISIQAAESGGSWSDGERVEYGDAYIRKVRSKFVKRVERIKIQTGEAISLDYKYDIEKEPLKTEYENAVSGKMDASRSLKLFSDILKDMEKVAEPIFDAEEKAYKSWEKEPKARGEWNLAQEMAATKDPAESEAKYVKANVFGTQIEAKYLGVILDTSPSMKEYLPTVRAAIAEKFPDLKLIETKGSFINQMDDNRWWWAEPAWASNPFQPEFYRNPINVADPFQLSWNAQLDAGNAVLAMAELAGFDALYWFTDFDDPMDGLSEFCERLEVSGIKLYIHPQNGRTPPLLRKIVLASGGEIIEADLDKLPKTTPPTPKTTKMDPAVPTSPDATPEVAENPKVKFQFKVYEAENSYGDDLQNKLLAAPTSSYSNRGIAEKMRQQDKAKLFSPIDFIANIGERASEASSDQMLSSVDTEFVHGLAVEVDTRISINGLYVNIVGTFAREVGGDVRVHRITTATEIQHDRDFLLGRWQEGKKSIFVIGNAILQKPPEALVSQKKQGGYVDISFYKSSRDIQGGRAPVARTVFPTIFGQRAKSELITPILFDADGSDEYEELGLITVVDTKLNPQGTGVSSELKLDFTEQPGGKERVPSGESVVKFDIHKFESNHEFTGDKPELLELSRTGFLNANPGPSKWVAVVKSIVPATVAERYSAQKLSMVDKPHADAIKSAAALYIRALTGALDDARSKGAAETVTAIEIEGKALKAGALEEAKFPTDPIVKDLRSKYRSLIRTAENNRVKNQRELERLFPNYTPAPKKIAKSDVFAKPTMAKAVVPPTKKPVVPPAAKKPNQSIPDSQFGKLVFEGTHEGKPVQVPDQLKDEPIGWVRIREGRRMLIGTKNKGVFEMNVKGELTSVFPTVAKKFALGFGRTVLTPDNELRWWYSGKKPRSMKGVSYFEVGSGPRGDSLLALKLDGTIELICPKNELKWDFKEWASKRRFTDVAIARWRGLQTVAMALDEHGELFAFNRLGFYKLPSEVKNNVASITSGLIGTNVAVIKIDGEIHEFTQGVPEKGVDLPLDSYLMENWKIFAAGTTASKPVDFRCGLYARTMQLEDGSWKAFEGRWAFTKPIFQEITRGGRFKDLQCAFWKNGDQFVLGIR